MNKLLLLSFIFLLVGCGEKQEQRPSKSKASGPQAIVNNAVFTTIEGDTVRVSDYEGQVVMIDFWETWCKPCLASFPGIERLADEYADDFKVLAVTPGFTNSIADARTFAEGHDYNFTYAMDPKGVHKQFGVQGIPYKIFIDANGQFVSASMGSRGPDGDYEHIKQIIEKNRRKEQSAGAKPSTR